MWKKKLRTVVGSFSLPSFLFGLLLFAASLTPSLIPRDAVPQGILGGLVTAIGYLLGELCGMVVRMLDVPRFPATFRAVLIRISAVAVTLLCVGMLAFSLIWQNEVRVMMGAPPATALKLGLIVLVAILTFIVFYALGRIVGELFRFVRGRLYRWISPRRANVVAAIIVLLTMVIVTRDGVLDYGITFVDKSYENAQNLFENAPTPPADSRMVGSEGSLIDWKGIGKPGRDFIMSGPDAEAISNFTGKAALDPIRVYVGRANAETARERAELALAELKRLGGFERKVMIIASPTGTGWLDPGAHDPVEYMHDGDIATVAVQYSYLQSPLALILETQTGLDQAVALQEAVHSHWKTLPEDDRPRLYVHGLSLGAWSSMHATNMFRLLDDPIDGAFWAGPPFPSDFWNYVQRNRNPDSPWVAPEIGDGSLIRYASNTKSAADAPSDWGSMRIVFLQYSSDPIVFYDPTSMWRAPVWMNESPAADVTDRLTFVPIVTQFQLALDMALSFDAPPGHGHAYYAQDYIEPWVEVTAPEGWSVADTQRLKRHCDNGVEVGCSHSLDGIGPVP